MKFFRNGMFGIVFLSVMLTSGIANAGVFRRCQVVNIAGIHYRWCEGRFRPGPPWWRHHRRRWRRRHHFRRCYVRVTPWGRVRRCERW
ncbi:MAG: hypothetical protein AAGG80_00685 [Pseudomonadota bacterium]